MWRSLTKFFWNIEVWAVQKHVNLVDLVESFPTSIFLQNLASMQPRTSRERELGIWREFGNLDDWKFQFQFPIPVGVGNANCGARFAIWAAYLEQGMTPGGSGVINRRVERLGGQGVCAPHDDFRGMQSSSRSVLLREPCAARTWLTSQLTTRSQKIFGIQSSAQAQS